MIRSKAALADGIGIDICSNETIRDGYCYGLAICGYCYNTNEDVVIKISDNYEIFNMVVISIILPIICIVGLAGNTVSAFIYSRKVMLSSMNVYLCALAISDMTVVLTAFFLFYLENVRRRSLFISKYYAIMTPVLFPLGLTAQTFSVFLTLIAAIDCFVLVAAPQSFKKHFCAIPRSVQILFVILFIAIIYNSPHIFEIYVIDCWSRRYAQKTVDVCPTDLRLNENYVKIYYAWMYTIIMAVGPMLSLILLNSAIVFFIKRNSSKESRNDSDIITLVLVVCLFIFCNILPVTVNFLELIFGVTNPYLLDMSNLIVVLNSSCNFMIYYMFGSRFRRTLQQYIKHKRFKMTVNLSCFSTEVIKNICEASAVVKKGLETLSKSRYNRMAEYFATKSHNDGLRRKKSVLDFAFTFSQPSVHREDPLKNSLIVLRLRVPNCSLKLKQAQLYSNVRTSLADELVKLHRSTSRQDYIASNSITQSINME